MTGRWRIRKCTFPGVCTRPWIVYGPPRRDFMTWSEALAYVDAQIRARALTALEGQP